MATELAVMWAIQPDYNDFFNHFKRRSSVPLPGIDQLLAELFVCGKYIMSDACVGEARAYAINLFLISTLICCARNC